MFYKHAFLVLIFAPKHRLWVHVRTTSPRHIVPTIYVLSKNKKNINFFLQKNFIFYNFKNLCILHRHVFVMNLVKFTTNLRQATIGRDSNPDHRGDQESVLTTTGMTMLFCK